METDNQKKKKWAEKLRNKYKLVVLNDETYEERLSFRLSRLNVFVVSGVVAIFLIVLTIILIAFTPLREYIPGYTDVTLYDRINELEEKADSLEMQFRQKSLYVYNLKRILEGQDTVAVIPEQVVAGTNYEDIRITPSKQDSILRADFEYQSMYNLYFSRDKGSNGNIPSIQTFNFFTPLNGIVSNEFNPVENHFGIDIVAKDDEAVKATLDGIVIFADWTLETGYVICLQHKNNIISIYKHNSTLLKEQGGFVKAGEPISIVGESGELTTGPHLHFEIWFNGVPVDPGNLMIF